MHETRHSKRTTQGEAARRTWVRPTLTRISATLAELNVGVTFDGSDQS